MYPASASVSSIVSREPGQTVFARRRAESTLWIDGRVGADGARLAHVERGGVDAHGEHAACLVVARPQLVVRVRQCARAAACPRRRQVGGESSGRKDSGEEREEMATRRITRRPHGPGSRAPPVRRRTSADKTGQAGCTAGASSQRRDPGCEGPSRGRPSRQRPCAQRSHGVAIRGRHGSRRQQARIDRDAVDLPDQHAQLAVDRQACRRHVWRAPPTSRGRRCPPAAPEKERCEGGVSVEAYMVIRLAANVTWPRRSRRQCQASQSLGDCALTTRARWRAISGFAAGSGRRTNLKRELCAPRWVRGVPLLPFGQCGGAAGARGAR